MLLAKSAGKPRNKHADTPCSEPLRRDSSATDSAGLSREWQDLDKYAITVSESLILYLSGLKQH